MSADKEAGATAPAHESTPSEVKTDDKAPVIEKEKTESEAAETQETEESAEDSDAEAVEGEESADDKPSRTKIRRENKKAQLAELKARAERESIRADAAERALRAISDDVGPEPKRESFDDEAKYTAALAAFEADKRIVARQKKAHETNVTDARSDAASSKAELFRARAMALTDRYPDMEAKVFQDQSLPMSATMAGVLMATEKGPEVAYYLSANRETAQRIKMMPPDEAAFELGQIAAKLSLPKSKTQSTAPVPPNTLSGSLKKVSVDPNTLKGDAYRKWRETQG